MASVTSVPSVVNPKGAPICSDRKTILAIAMIFGACVAEGLRRGQQEQSSLGLSFLHNYAAVDKSFWFKYW